MIMRIGWVFAVAVTLAACGGTSGDTKPSGAKAATDTATTPVAIDIPDVVPNSRAVAARRLDEALILFSGDDSISFAMTGSLGDIGSAEVRGSVNLQTESSESVYRFDYGDDASVVLESRIVGERAFGRIQPEPCWFDYGDDPGEEAFNPWLPPALGVGSEGVAEEDENLIVAEVPALLAMSSASSKLARTLPPEALATKAVVKVVITLDGGGRVVEAAFNYEDAFDALTDDGIDLAALAAESDPELVGETAESMRQSVAGPYVATYAPAESVDVTVPSRDEVCEDVQ